MSAKNFRINKEQAWTLSNLGHYTDNGEIVINSDSYDNVEETFNFAIKLKDEAPDSVWKTVEYMMPNEAGFLFFTMESDGKFDEMEEK